ncbi:ternary complex factor MIP1 protein [Tanacetum coccineum]
MKSMFIVLSRGSIYIEPLGALPTSLSAYRPCDKVAVLEKTLCYGLERNNRFNFRQGLYQEAVYISSSKRNLENSLDYQESKDGKTKASKLSPQTGDAIIRHPLLLLGKLTSLNLTSLTHQEKAAFWIIGVNSCMMNAFLEHGIPESPEMVVQLMQKATHNCWRPLFEAVSRSNHFIRARLPYHSNIHLCEGCKDDEITARSQESDYAYKSDVFEVVVVLVLRVLVTCRSKLKLLKLVKEKISGTQWEAIFRSETRGYTVLEIIQDEVFDRFHDEDAVSLCCLGILQLVLLGAEAKRWIPDWMLRLANDRVG